MVNKQELINQIAEEEIIVKAIKSKELLEDLFEFNKQVLKVEEGGVPLAPFHKELCEFVETWEGKKKRKLILLPRGHLKSTLVTVGYSLQQIAKDPSIRILIANATYTMACSFLGQIKSHLEKNETFIEMYGELAKEAPKWSEGAVRLLSDRTYQKKENTITAFGMESALTSQHYDLVILDDLVNRDNIGTRVQVEKVISAYKDVLDLLEPDGHVVIIGTRWHDSDLYGHVIESENAGDNYFDIVVRQAVEGGDETTMDTFLETGEVLFPDKFRREYLKQLRAEKGKYDFACQYLNNPVPDAEATFRKDWIRTFAQDEVRERPMNFFTFVDPALSTAKTADYTAIVTIGVDQYLNIYIRDIFREKVNPTELINWVFRTYEEWRPRKICIESLAFQKSLQHFIYREMAVRGISLPIEEVKPEFRETKELRIRGLVPYYEQGKIFHPLYHRNTQFLDNELLRFPVGKHDDIIDALSYFPKVIYPPRAKKAGYKKRRNRYLY